MQLSGRGNIFSFTVIREVVGQALRGFAPDIPYVTAWIDLDEGPRFCSNIVGCAVDKVHIDMKDVYSDVEAADDDEEEEIEEKEYNGIFEEKKVEEDLIKIGIL